MGVELTPAALNQRMTSSADLGWNDLVGCAVMVAGRRSHLSRLAVAADFATDLVGYGRAREQRYRNKDCRYLSFGHGRILDSGHLDAQLRFRVAAEILIRSAGSAEPTPDDHEIGHIPHLVSP